MGLQIMLEHKEKSLVVHLFGELDHHYAIEIREKIDVEIFSSNVDKLIFDFSNVSFMDSSGIGVIMGRYKMMQARGGCVVLAAVNQNVEKLMSVSGLRKIIPEFHTLDEALTYAGGKTE